MPTDCQFPHDARHPWQFMVRCFWLHIQTALFLVNVDTISGHYREKSTVVCAFYRRLAALVIWKKRKSGKKTHKEYQKQNSTVYLQMVSARMDKNVVTAVEAEDVHMRPGYKICVAWGMMTSSNENIFLVTGPLCGKFTGHRWIPLTKASDAELWCFLCWSVTE